MATDANRNALPSHLADRNEVDPTLLADLSHSLPLRTAPGRAPGEFQNGNPMASQKVQRSSRLET